MAPSPLPAGSLLENEPALETKRRPSRVAINPERRRVVWEEQTHDGEIDALTPVSGILAGVIIGGSLWLALLIPLLYFMLA